MHAPSFDRLAAALVRHAPRAPFVESHLEAALAQTVGRTGKLFRAHLVYTAAGRHGLKRRAAEKLACAVEYFHAASLVLDDLPCMDNATLRRGLPCIHRQHGEATAILVALALINRAYFLAGDALATQPARVRAEARRCLDRCLGVAGLVGGQAWDLAFAGTSRSPRVIGSIAAAKTGALFELAILLPAALARPRTHERRALRALCVYWGQLFQAADDLRDVLSSSYVSGKSAGRDQQLTRPNLALALGVPAVRERVARLTRQSSRVVDGLVSGENSRWGYLGEAGAAMRKLLSIPDESRTAAA